MSSDPEDPTNYYNDANYCDPEYDKLYQQQKVELDRDKREQIVHEMLTRCSRHLHVLYTEPELQAYRKGRFEGFVRQPARIGPVVYQQTSPTYAALKPASASAGGDDGGGSGAIIAIIAVVVIGGGVAFFLLRRRRTVYERE